MHVYLSSFLLGDAASVLPSLARTPTAVVIGNALDHAVPAIRTSYTEQSIASLSALGFSTAELDLRDYFSAPATIEGRLDEVGLVWANGGNVFLLRRAMQQSGLDRYILARRRDEGFVYGGFSAGACVAGPTLRGAEFVDTLEATAAGYTNTVMWDGLGLVPYSIAPHHKSGHQDSAGVDAMVEYFIANKLPFVALRDGESIITVAA